LFEQLEKINNPPEPFEFYTAADLWTDDYTSEQHRLIYQILTDINTVKVIRMWTHYE